MLEPIDRISEILFGLIMALTFTRALNADTASGADVSSLVRAALGCNIAWGLVDGAMYVSTGLIERFHGARLRAALKAAGPAEGGALIREVFPADVASTLREDELEVIRRAIERLPEPATPRVRARDLREGFAVASLVFLSTFPVVLPFLLFDSPSVGLRVSNVVAVVMLFGCGSALGRYAGGRPWRVGAAMAVLGLVLVAITVALGG